MSPQKPDRKLVKFTGAAQTSQPLKDLECATETTVEFDQFKGKKSSYDFTQYTTKIDKAKLTPEKIEAALSLERELSTKTAT